MSIFGPRFNPVLDSVLTSHARPAARMLSVTTSASLSAILWILRKLRLVAYGVSLFWARSLWRTFVRLFPTRKFAYLFVSVATLFAFRKFLLRSSRRIVTTLISRTQIRPNLSANTVKNVFNGMAPTAFKPQINHTHPVAAADRSVASIHADRVSRGLGLTAYFVQRSLNDEKHGRLGSRDYYWTKDLSASPAVLDVPENALVVMVDVDQYLDMPDFLTSSPHPTLIYTFQPGQVARSTETDYSYTFDKLDQVVFRTTGGGSYTHKVWNFSTDHLVTRKTFLGIPYKTAAFAVDRVRTSMDREMIMLSPLGSWGLLGSILHRCFMEGRELKRLALNTKSGFLRLAVSSKKGMEVSTGKPDSFLVSLVPASVDDTISAVSRTSKYPLTMPQVLSYVAGDRSSAAILLDYHRTVAGEKVDVVCPVPEATNHYQYNPYAFDSEAKPMLKAFMTPLVHGAFAPSVGLNNEEECIRARVERPRPKELPMRPFIALTMQEFLERFIPDKDKQSLDPTDHDELLDRQHTPAQRQLLGQAEADLPTRTIQMFLKREAYANVKAPRPISVINSSDKRDYSCFIYALGKFLKSAPWYAFGLTPKKVAQRVVEILLLADFATPTDFNKYDGHGSNLMREFERNLLMRAFRTQHHEEVLRLHRTQFGLKAYGVFETWYETAFSRASGSPETSTFNTIFNAYIAFLAGRMTRVDGLCMEADASYANLGIYGGDDGLTTGIPAEQYTRAALAMGQELTVETVQRGDAGIKFLARIYSPEVWCGETSSCCDIARQLSKFHVTVNFPSDVTAVDKLLEKTRCFILTDENTPIIGDFAKTVMRFHSGEIKVNDKLVRMQQYNSHFDRTKQYDNTPGTWMMDYVETALPEFDFKRFTKWLAAADSMQYLMTPPMFMQPIEAKSEIPVVVGEVVLPHGAPVVPLPKREPCVGVSEHINSILQHQPRKQSFASCKLARSKVVGGNLEPAWAEDLPVPMALVPVRALPMVRPSYLRDGLVKPKRIPRLDVGKGESVHPKDQLLQAHTGHGLRTWAKK